MKPVTGLLLGLTGLLGAAQAIAADADAVAQADARRVAITVCATCHGVQGRNEQPKFPQLAGQHANYLATQLRNFRAQTRGDPDALAYMWGMAATLDDEMVDALAAYYSGQRGPPGARSEPALVARGREIYANGIAAEGIPPCASCHGPAALGTDEFPRLAGQHAQYVLKQLRSFKNNLRNVAIMHGVAGGLQGAEMDAVAAYLQSLGS
ncbi:MAG: c-type cytochrome [Steroidobacteraceae bacterium]